VNGDRLTIPAAIGPLPRVGTRAYGRLSDRFQNAGLEGFNSQDAAIVAASWWARLHGLPSAFVQQASNTGRWTCWA
jgi:hypothetical protein